MRIEINEKGSSNYYDEFLFIAYNYNKINNNPNMRIHGLTFNAYIYLIISVVIGIIFTILYFIFRDKICLFTVILFILTSILSFVHIYLLKRCINKYINSHKKSTIEINKSGILAETEDSKFEIEADVLKAIIIGKYTITFIPNDSSKHFITTRIEYKDKIVKALKKYKLDKYII